MKNILCLLLIGGLQPAFAQKSNFDLAAARQQIENANLTYGDRFQSDDPEFYKARYTADACIMPEKMPRICGRDGIRAYYFNGGQNRDFRLKIIATEISGGEKALIEEGTYDLLDKAGTVLDKGKFIATWVLEDKKWKLRREIWTTDMAPAEPETQTGYDSLLAKKLGADDYGMKKYVLVLLKTGPAEISDKAEIDKHFAGHMANIGRLAAEGKLVLAGPIGRKEKYRGLFVFEVADIEEAKTLTATDPAIQAGLLEPEFMPYYGSAALKMVTEWHERLAAKKF